MKIVANKSNKQPARKETKSRIWDKPEWRVSRGRLVPPRGRPRKTKALFSVVAEKIPKEALDSIASDMRAGGIRANGVYIAHDSMGYARYIGRGAIFNRLRARFRAQTLELAYFSFYVVLDRCHEREIETLLIRAAGPHLHFNSRKKRVDIQPGNVRDFEAGTTFYERRYKRGHRRNG